MNSKAKLLQKLAPFPHGPREKSRIKLVEYNIYVRRVATSRYYGYVGFIQYIKIFDCMFSNWSTCPDNKKTQYFNTMESEKPETICCECSCVQESYS